MGVAYVAVSSATSSQEGVVAVKGAMGASWHGPGVHHWRVTTNCVRCTGELKWWQKWQMQSDLA